MPGSAGLSGFGLVSPDRGVGRADHQQRGAVQNRHRDLGRPGVVRADVEHHVGIGGGRLGVARFLLGRPLASRGGGIVTVEIVESEIAHLIVRLVQRHPDAVDDRVGLLPGIAGARQAGDDLDKPGRAGSGCLLFAATAQHEGREDRQIPPKRRNRLHPATTSRDTRTRAHSNDRRSGQSIGVCHWRVVCHWHVVACCVPLASNVCQWKPRAASSNVRNWNQFGPHVVVEGIATDRLRLQCHPS